MLDEGGIAHVMNAGVPLDGADAWASVPAEVETQVLDAVAECPEQAITVR